jgi:hypothetical protein
MANAEIDRHKIPERDMKEKDEGPEEGVCVAQVPK